MSSAIDLSPGAGGTDADTAEPLRGMRFIDLFAGIGAFRIALGSLGARCVFSSEWDEAAKDVYERNFGDRPQGDITKVTAPSVPDHEILCAGFPCQAFSISGKRRGFEDARGTLFFEVARIAKEKRPACVFMENVRNFAAHDGGRTLATVRSVMEGLGYSFSFKILDAADYGIPQKRERIYMVCFRDDLGISGFRFPDPFPLKRHVKDFLEEPASVPEKCFVSRPVEWKERPACPDYSRPVRIGTVGKGGQGERIYSPEGCAVTFSAFGGGVFAKTGGYLVGGRTRRLTPRECARLMGFPDSFSMASDAGHAYRQFGNSAVVDVLRLIALGISVSLAGCIGRNGTLSGSGKESIS